jgi:hypothetical protein
MLFHREISISSRLPLDFLINASNNHYKGDFVLNVGLFRARGKGFNGNN